MIICQDIVSPILVFQYDNKTIDTFYSDNTDNDVVIDNI